jgi:hypothetical protein
MLYANSLDLFRSISTETPKSRKHKHTDVFEGFLPIEKIPCGKKFV